MERKLEEQLVALAPGQSLEVVDDDGKVTRYERLDESRRTATGNCKHVFVMDSDNPVHYSCGLCGYGKYGINPQSVDK